jgi:hypothetical protein
MTIAVDQYLTEADLNALKQEAAAAGDFAQMELCDRALAGDMPALVACELVVMASAYDMCD